MTRYSSRGVTWSSEVSTQGAFFEKLSSEDWSAYKDNGGGVKQASMYQSSTRPYNRNRPFESTPADVSANFIPISMENKAGEAWRKHGKLHRARLLVKDEEEGGNTFVLSESCRIEKYYEVAGKVMDQFLRTSVDETKDLTESYLVGNRLVKFLSTVLPTHPQYFLDSPRLVQHRNNSQEQLVQMMQYIDQLALIIDEFEYNRYILKDLNGKDDSKSNSLLDANNLSFEEPSVYLDESSVTSQEEFAANIDAEFAGVGQFRLHQTQKDNSSSWDGYYSQYASQHENPRVRKHKKNSRSQWHSKNYGHAEAKAEPVVWQPSFPLSFSEKVQAGKRRSTVSGSSGNTVDFDALYSPRVKGDKHAMVVPVSRRQSPKSAEEFPEWVAPDEEASQTGQSMGSSAIKGYLELLAEEERLPPCDVSSVATSEEEELSLTDGRRASQRRQLTLSKFKGCIKCLLD